MRLSISPADRTCGNMFGEMEVGSIGKGEGSCSEEPFSRHPEKQLAPWLFFTWRQQN